MPQKQNSYEESASRQKNSKGSAVIAADLPAEKKKTAVALEYDPKEASPKILATGRGIIAERIIESAKEHQVPVHKDERLANTLSRLEVGDFIPPELYEVVAEVFLFVDRLDRIKEKLARNE